MSKIELPTITSGHNLSAINNNFQKIEDALNKEVLYRKNYVGEPNEMQANLDMNSKEILNVSVGTSPGSLVTKGYVDQEIAEERAYVDQELANKYDKAGGLVYGNVLMQGNRISGLPNGSQPTEPATYAQLLAMETDGDSLLRQDLAALGGAGLIGPGVMTRGVDKFSIMQGREGEYRQDTLTRGLAVELDEPITGSGFVGATNTYMFNRFRVKDDRVDAQNDGTAGTKVDGLVVQHDFGGAGARGGRHAAEFMLTQKAPTESDNADRHYVGVVGYSATSSGDGGTDMLTGKRGAYFGGNFYTAIRNAPFVFHANGCESNVTIDAASSVYYRTGYSAVSGGALQATMYDAAYSVGALGDSGAQWKDGILMGVQNGRNPISRSMIRGEDLSVSRILSFSGSIPSNIITSDTDTRFNFRADRLEMFYANASLKLGAKDSVNTPVIEAYTDATGNRAGRLIFNGDAATPDNGVCNVQFRQTVVRELAPGAANTFKCGTASLPWSGGFTQAAFTVTSDERTKTKPEAFPSAMLDAAAEVDWVLFQYLDRVEEKGTDGARWHFGAIAQRFVEAFQKHGLDPFRFAFICYDEWDAAPEVIAEDGEVISPAVDAGSRYGIRYEQAIILKQKQIERDIRRKYDEKLGNLEARLALLEMR